MKSFTFFWLDGKREVLKGDFAADAAIKAGYGNGAFSALDFWAEGDNKDYKWINGEWIRS